MKKVLRFLLIMLTISLVVSAALTFGLGYFYDDIFDNSVKVSTLTRNELTMELTEDFEYDFYQGYGSEDVYISDEHLVGIYHTYIEEVTLKDKPSPSLRVYASLFFPMYVGLEKTDEIVLDEIDGILCYEADINENGEIDSFISFFETETSFYFVRMTYNRKKTTYEESRDLFISWAKSVKFNESSAEE